MSRRSEPKSDGLQQRYSTVLKKYLARTPGTTLGAAEKLGRQAASAELSTSALATIHKNALMKLIPSGATPSAIDGKISRASTFFVAALKPMDSTRGAMAAENSRLSRLKESMRRSTLELAGARRRLKRELTRRKKLEADLKESRREHAQLMKSAIRAQEQLRGLSHQILSAQEQERARISRELHDEIGQTLTAVTIKLATLTAQANINAKALKQTIRSTQRLLELSMSKVHRFARSLRPPLLDDLGLIPALRAYLDEFTRQTAIPVNFTIFAGVENMHGDKRTVLYRVVQEAVTNIAAHAEASLVDVEIRRDGSNVWMEIRDNGKGFDVKSRLHARRITRLGLLGMRERMEMVGGSLDIRSTRGEGTTIRAQMPFDGPKRAPRVKHRLLGK